MKYDRFYELWARRVVTQRYQLIYSVQSAGDYVPSHFRVPAVARMGITAQTPRLSDDALLQFSLILKLLGVCKFLIRNLWVSGCKFSA